MLNSEGNFATALQGLKGMKRPVVASKIKAVAECALQYQSEYKLVVYEVEKFIKKSEPEDRILGVFVLDSICRMVTMNFQLFTKISSS